MKSSVGIFGKLNPTKPEKQVLHELTRSLAGGHEAPGKWDITVPDDIANAILKNIGATRGMLTMHDVVRDIDIMIARGLADVRSHG